MTTDDEEMKVMKSEWREDQLWARQGTRKQRDVRSRSSVTVPTSVSRPKSHSC